MRQEFTSVPIEIIVPAVYHSPHNAKYNHTRQLGSGSADAKTSGIASWFWSLLVKDVQDQDHQIYHLPSSANDSAIVRPFDEPITFALLASTQLILSTVNTVTEGIRSLFVREETPDLETGFPGAPEAVVSDYREPKLTKVDSPILSIIDTDSEYAKAESHTSSHVVDSAFSAQVESVEEHYDEGFWEETTDLPSESSSYFGIESFIDTSSDAHIQEQPIPKRRLHKPRSSVHFDPLVELMNSAVVGDFDSIKRSIVSKQFLVNDTDQLGYCLLHYAASYGHCEIVKYLLKHGADVNLLESESWSALHFGAIANHLKVVKVLLDAGANVDCPNDNGETADELTDDEKIQTAIREVRNKKLTAKKVKALYDWPATGHDELPLCKGATLKVLERQPDWWLLQDDRKNIGAVPRIFVQ
jgi:hypothetical protein